jgi:hypothetical protein
MDGEQGAMIDSEPSFGQIQAIGWIIEDFPDCVSDFVLHLCERIMFPRMLPMTGKYRPLRGLFYVIDWMAEAAVFRFQAKWAGGFQGSSKQRSRNRI